MLTKSNAVLVGVLLLLGLAIPFADAAVKPMVGVTDHYNEGMCGSNDWERIKTPVTEFAVSDGAGTCVSGERHHASFAVTSIPKEIVSQYPNIATGYVPEGEPTCASSADTCFDFPVQQKNDGMPLASFDSWISGGYEGNEAFDIWFSPTESRHSYATSAGDTELMIWTAWPRPAGPCTTVTVITKLGGMVRWEPGTRERLQAAALELFATRGFEQVTAAEIAQAVGLTERTFFRNFGDKREVLFHGQERFLQAFVDGVKEAPAEAAPLELIAAALQASAAIFPDERRPYSRLRQAVIDQNPALQERELHKLAGLAATLATAFRERGVAEPAATLAAQSAATVFGIAFAQWIRDGESRPLADIASDVLRELGNLTGAAAHPEPTL